jgi:hypothetical protein
VCKMSLALAYDCDYDPQDRFYMPPHAWQLGHRYFCRSLNVSIASHAERHRSLQVLSQLSGKESFSLLCEDLSVSSVEDEGLLVEVTQTEPVYGKAVMDSPVSGRLSANGKTIRYDEDSGL